MPPLSRPAGGDYSTDLPWRPAVNGAGETVPAFALVRVTARDGAGVYTVAKPDTDNGPVWVNSPLDIATGTGAGGAVTAAGPVDALYDTADGTPAVGETWGAGAGSFKLRKDKAGFVVVSAGDPETETCGVAVAAGSGALTVEENDGSPSYTGITTLRFDQADGFTITNPSDGVARVDFAGVTGSGTGYRLAYWSPSSSTALLSSGIDTVDGNSVRAPGVGRFGGNLTAGFGTDFTAVFDLGSSFLASLLLTAETRYLKIEIPGSTLPSTVAQLRASGLTTLRLDGAAYDTTVGYSVAGVAGATGTTAAGDTVEGGIVTAIGGASYVSTAGANTFTNQNTFQPATAATVPLTIQGAASQSANLSEWKSNGGSVLASVSAAGVLTAAALNGTYDAGTW